MVACEANWEDPTASRTNIEWARELARDLEPFSRGRSYLNFAGLGEGGERLVRAAYGPNYDRLRALKQQYDPDNVFHLNHNITP